MKTSADPATRISPDAGREKTPRPARSACCATVPTSSDNVCLGGAYQAPGLNVDRRGPGERGGGADAAGGGDDAVGDHRDLGAAARPAGGVGAAGDLPGGAL